MKAILYARFSPRPNAAECESCESQLADLRAYCQQHGHDVAGEYTDKALSGGNDWTDRPGMFDAAQACKRGYVFVVRSFDRLFRDTHKALMFAAMLESKKVNILSVTEEAASLNTPESRLMRGQFLLFAEYHREIIRARTRAKMVQHQRNGRRMSHEPPYGTMLDPVDAKRLVPNPDEQNVIRRIRRLRDLGLGLRAIARELESSGIPRRGKATWNHGLVKSVLVRDESTA